MRLGGEITFCLSTLCHRTLDEISRQMEMRSANILAMPAHELWVKQNLFLSLCTANACNIGDDTVWGLLAKKSVTPTSF